MPVYTGSAIHLLSMPGGQNNRQVIVMANVTKAHDQDLDVYNDKFIWDLCQCDTSHHV